MYSKIYYVDKRVTVSNSASDFADSLDLNDHILKTAGQSSFVNVTTSTKDLKPADSGKTIILNVATGSALTLPSASEGLVYRVITATDLSSGSYTITAKGADLLTGGILSVDDVTPEAAAMFKPDVSDDLIITFNGTTTGGEIGTDITITAISSDRWYVSGTVAANGTLATPFS
jgi:hypothetical protein